MVCPNCGYNNQTGNRFCVRCGIDIAAPAAPDTPSFDAAAPAGAAAPPPPPSYAPPVAPPVAPPATAPPTAAPAPPNPWGAPPQPQSEWASPGQAPPPPPPYPGGPGAAPPNPFAPPVPYGPPGAYPPPYPPSGYPPASTNGLAIAALVLGIVGWVPCGVGSVLAVILGFVARNQIREARGRQGGDGLALAGIILGFLGIGLYVLIIVLSAVTSSTNG